VEGEIESATDFTDFHGLRKNKIFNTGDTGEHEVDRPIGMEFIFGFVLSVRIREIGG
jgi:hypothetical protein